MQTVVASAIVKLEQFIIQSLFHIVWLVLGSTNPLQPTKKAQMALLCKIS